MKATSYKVLRISKIILLVMLYRMAYVSSWDSRGPIWASSFMIDSGSAINIIKIGSLKDPKLNEDDKIILCRIAQTAVEIYGSVAIRLLNCSIKFYVVSDDNVSQR